MIAHIDGHMDELDKLQNESVNHSPNELIEIYTIYSKSYKLKKVSINVIERANMCVYIYIYGCRIIRLV